MKYVKSVNITDSEIKVPLAKVKEEIEKDNFV